MPVASTRPCRGGWSLIDQDLVGEAQLIQGREILSGLGDYVPVAVDGCVGRTMAKLTVFGSEIIASAPKRSAKQLACSSGFRKACLKCLLLEIRSGFDALDAPDAPVPGAPTVLTL